jgi:hypothetical protein
MGEKFIWVKGKGFIDIFFEDENGDLCVTTIYLHPHYKVDDQYYRNRHKRFRVTRNLLRRTKPIVKVSESEMQNYLQIRSGSMFGYYGELIKII